MIKFMLTKNIIREVDMSFKSYTLKNKADAAKIKLDDAKSIFLKFLESRKNINVAAYNAGYAASNARDEYTIAASLADFNHTTYSISSLQYQRASAAYQENNAAANLFDRVKDLYSVYERDLHNLKESLIILGNARDAFEMAESMALKLYQDAKQCEDDNYKYNKYEAYKNANISYKNAVENSKNAPLSYRLAAVALFTLPLAIVLDVVILPFQLLASLTVEIKSLFCKRDHGSIDGSLTKDNTSELPSSFNSKLNKKSIAVWAGTEFVEIEDCELAEEKIVTTLPLFENKTLLQHNVNLLFCPAFASLIRNVGQECKKHKKIAWQICTGVTL